MEIDEESANRILKQIDPFIVPNDVTEITNGVGYLRKESTFVNCPACEGEALSVVRSEEVTCLQRFLKFANWWQNWSGHADVNHYCSKCGCYIGRYVPLRCTERCISKKARKKAANDQMVLKTKPKDCAGRMQAARERVKEKQNATRAG